MSFFHCFTIDLTDRQRAEYTWWDLIKRYIMVPGYKTRVRYRIARTFANASWTGVPGKMLSKYLLARLSLCPGVEIKAHKDIGPGISFPHPHDIVIGEGSSVGSNVTIYNGVTLGARNLLDQDTIQTVEDRYPTIEDNVILFPGAKILGPVIIGKNSIVGANSVVLESFPPDSIIAGVPGRLIRSRERV